MKKIIIIIFILFLFFLTSCESKQTQDAQLKEELEQALINNGILEKQLKDKEEEKKHLQEENEILKQQLENNQIALDEINYIEQKYQEFKINYPNYEGTIFDWIKDFLEVNTCNLYGHSFDEGTLTTHPTTTQEGEKIYTCTICQENKYEVVPKLEDIEIFEENGISYLYLGKYPQSLVDDSTIISALDNISTTNEFGYIEYNGNEYKKVTATPYSTSYTFANGQTIVEGNTYYFKVEPIKWRILESNDGTYKLLSEIILDNAQFHTTSSTRIINEQTIYSNNYEYSNIRAWLNGYDGTSYNVDNYMNKGFIDIAFTEQEKDLINETLVDNSLSSTRDSSNPYICNNTIDKIYLLSVDETLNTNYGFSNNRGSSSARQAITSDYARSKGCWLDFDSSYYGNVAWWLRSPLFFWDYYMYVVNPNGNLSGSIYDSVNWTHHGVRVACTINLKP